MLLACFKNNTFLKVFLGFFFKSETHHQLYCTKVLYLGNNKCFDYLCVCRKPASRFEVVQLKSTMEEMLEKAGINDADIEIKGPTQVRLSRHTGQKYIQNMTILFH